jgi:hypothetical protein
MAPLTLHVTFLLLLAEETLMKVMVLLLLFLMISLGEIVKQSRNQLVTTPGVLHVNTALWPSVTVVFLRNESVPLDPSHEQVLPCPLTTREAE